MTALFVAAAVADLIAALLFRIEQLVGDSEAFDDDLDKSSDNDDATDDGLRLWLSSIDDDEDEEDDEPDEGDVTSDMDKSSGLSAHRESRKNKINDLRVSSKARALLFSSPSFFSFYRLVYGPECQSGGLMWNLI